MIDIYEFHVYNPLTSKSSVIFTPSTISYAQGLLRLSDQAYKYDGRDPENGTCVKNRGVWPKFGETVRLSDFRTNSDVYSFLMDDNYPEDRVLYLRKLVPTLRNYGGAFAKIEMNAVDSKLYHTYVSAFWRVQL